MAAINPCVNGYRFKKGTSKYPWTQQEINYVWQWAKDHYIDQGDHPNDAIYNTARDLGLKPEWVLDAFSRTKTQKHITSQLYTEMSRRRAASDYARNQMRAMEMTGLQKAIRTAWMTPFSLKVGFHGTVGMQTHAGEGLFHPTTWFYRTPEGNLGGYWPNFFKQFRYVMDPAAHEMAMQELIHRENFSLARQAGLANDPTRVYTDYGYFAQQIPKLTGGEMGKRGFDILKKYRQDEFDHEWAKAPAEYRANPDTPEALEWAKGLARSINHSTGALMSGDEAGLATSAYMSKTANELMFAARLEGSRWARVFTDPAKAINTAARWKEASPADRAFAKRTAFRAVEFVTAYYLSLVANDGLQAAMGSKNRVNLSDPSRSDFWAHKVGDHTLLMEGRVTAPIRLLARMVQATWKPGPAEKRDDPFVRNVKAVGYYARGKLAPTPELATEAYTGQSFEGRPLPWTKGPTKPGKPRETWLEAGSSLLPIPGEGFVRDMYESMRSRGMSHIQAQDVLNGLLTLGIEQTGVGYRKTPEIRHRPTAGSAFTQPRGHSGRGNAFQQKSGGF